MAVLSVTALNLADWAKRLDPDGSIAKIGELLHKSNPLIEDIPFIEANGPTSHRTTVRTALPGVAWRLLNAGTAATKSTTSQATESIGILNAWSEVDRDLAELNGNVNAFRLSEATAFIEAMGQEMASTMFYGNAGTDPEEFTGLALRYDDTDATSGQNIIDGAGSGSDNSSIWLIVWGENTVHGIYPKGSKAGLEHEDLGLVTVDLGTTVGGSRMRAYQDHFVWKAGLCVKDWRYCARLANIDISNLGGGSEEDITTGMIKMMHRIPNMSAGKPCFYMNRTCMQFLDLQRRADVAAAGMTYAEVDGKLQPHFRGVPIRVTDALVETETHLTTTAGGGIPA